MLKNKYLKLSFSIILSLGLFFFIKTNTYALNCSGTGYILNRTATCNSVSKECTVSWGYSSAGSCTTSIDNNGICSSNGTCGRCAYKIDSNAACTYNSAGECNGVQDLTLGGGAPCGSAAAADYNCTNSPNVCWFDNNDAAFGGCCCGGSCGSLPSTSCDADYGNWKNEGCGGGACGSNDMAQSKRNSCGASQFRCQDDNYGDWNNATCGGGTCDANEMRQTRWVENGCQYNSSKCVADSAGDWKNGVCGGGTCDANQMRQTRSTIFGCLSSSKCVNDSATAWTNDVCGGGGCSANQMRQTRSTTFGCLSSSKCVTDSATAWTNDVCGGGGCSANQMHQTRKSTFNCIDESKCVDNITCIPSPDLTITNFIFPAGNPGGTGIATMTVNNIGSLDTVAAININIKNNTGATSQPFSTAALTAGSSRDVSFTVNKPAAAGPYRASAVADPGNLIVESNDANNTAFDDYRLSLTTLPDLEITSFTYPDGDPGTVGTALFTIRNNSTVGTGTSISLSITNGSPGSTPISLSAVNAMAAGETRNISRAITRPIVTSDPSFTATAEINPTRSINESNTGNNTRTDVYTVNAPADTFYKISGGVFEDTLIGGIYNGQKDGSETYINIPVSIDGTLITEKEADLSFSESYPDGEYPVTVDLASQPYIRSPNGITLSQTVKIGPNAPGCSPNSFCQANDIVGLDFGVIRTAQEAWIQGIGGDMRPKSTYVNPLPADTPFSKSDGNLSFGVVFGNSGNLGAGKANNSNWLVNSPFTSNISSSYLNVVNRLQKANRWDSATSCPDNPCNIATLAPGVYKSDILNISQSLIPNTSDKKGSYIFVVNEDIAINGNIDVPAGTSLIIVARRNITVNSNVSQIEGIFSAGDNFNIPPNLSGTDIPLTIEGTVIANSDLDGGAFNNDRTLSSNETTPAVLIKFRPDFILSLPNLLYDAEIKIEEVAPGE